MTSEREGEARGRLEPPGEPAEFLRRLQEVDPGERRGHLFRHVCEQVARTLGPEGAPAPDPARPLTEQGLTSACAVELAKELGNAIGRTLSPTVMFNYSTIDAAVAYLARQLGLEEPDADRPEEDGEDALLEEVSQLSEEELEAYVGEELEKLLE